MNIEDLEEELSSLFPDGYKITFDREGHLAIKTNLLKDEDGELICSDEELEEDDALEAISNRSKSKNDPKWDLDEDEDEEDDELADLEIVEEED